MVKTFYVPRDQMGTVVVLIIILLYYNSIVGGPAQIPEIVFVCDKYDLQGEPCEITFMDKYGKSYYSEVEG